MAAIALVVGVPGTAQAQTKSPEYCTYPGAPEEPGICSFDRDCMPPTAGKCQRIRDQRWSIRCTGLASGIWSPERGWEDYCRQEAAARGVAVPPPKQGPRAVATPTPSPTPSPVPRGGADPDAPGGQSSPDPGPDGGSVPPGTSPDGGPASPEKGTSGSEAVDSLEGSSVACLMYPLAVNCQRYWKKSPRRAYPLSHYELDDYSSSRALSPGTWGPSILQWLNTVIWYALLQFVDGALKLLEWAFNQRLFGTEANRGWITNTELEQILRDIFGALGSSWMTLGLLVAAGWGVWNGLVRQRTIQTLGGLLATLALMAGALVVITAPDKTIGALTNAVDDGAKAGFAIASKGSVEDLDGAQVDAQQGAFTALVHVPWEALTFGDIEKARETADWDGVDGEETLAAGYLKHPIDRTLSEQVGGVGGMAIDMLPDAIVDGDQHIGPRRTAYERLHEQGAQYTQLQELDGAMSRFGLLMLIAAGLAAAIALLLSLGVRLIMASIRVLVRVILLPAMMLAAACGETGRNAFIEYVKGTVEAVFEKWVYSIFFGVVVLGSNLITKLDLGFYDRWWLMIAYWWGMFLGREELIAMMMLDQGGRRTGGGRSGFGLFGAAVQYRAFRQIAGDAVRLGRRTVGAAAAGPLAAGRILQRDHDRHNEAAGRRDATHAENELRGRFGQAHEARRQHAQNTFNEQERRRQQLRAIEQQKRENARDRGDAIRQHQQTGGGPLPPGHLAPYDRREAALTARADVLKGELADPRYRAAERFLATHGDGPMVMGEREFAAAVDQRRAELDLRPDDDVNLISAGIDPEQYRANAAAALGTAQRATADRQLAQATAAMDRDRELIGGLYDRHGDRYRTLRDEQHVAPGGEYRAARRQLRRESRESRGRDRMFRR